MTYHEGAGFRPRAKDSAGSDYSQKKLADQRQVPNDILSASPRYDIDTPDIPDHSAQGLIQTLAEDPKSGRVEDPEYPNCNCQCPDCKSNDHCGLSKCWNG